MNEEVAFNMIVSHLDGTQKGMILKPYAKNIAYTPGHLSLSLQLFGVNEEIEVEATIEIPEDLDILIKGLIGEDVG